MCVCMYISVKQSFNAVCPSQIQELEQFMRTKKIDLPDPLGKDLPEQVLTIVERCGPLFQEEGLSSPGEQRRQ